MPGFQPVRVSTKNADWSLKILDGGDDPVGNESEGAGILVSYQRFADEFFSGELWSDFELRAYAL